MTMKILSVIIGAGLALFIMVVPARAFIKPPPFVVRTKKTAPVPPVSRPVQAASKPAKIVRKDLPQPPVGTVPQDISPETAEVVWLYHKGFSNAELLHYVDRSHDVFKLSVRDVNYLTDIGVSSPVVFAMLRSPAVRENVVNLRNRLPQHHVVKNAKKGNKQPELPQNALENSHTLESATMETKSDDNQIPNYYGPSNIPDRTSSRARNWLENRMHLDERQDKGPFDNERRILR
jgi:hypothetical protein